MPNATASEIPVQRRARRDEVRVMEPERTPATASGAGAAALFESRLDELSRMLEILERARTASGVDTRPKRFEGDPVALTQALHPNGLRPTRRSRAPIAPRDPRGMPVRLVVFDGSPRT